MKSSTVSLRVTKTKSPSVTKRIAIEAGVTALWWKYVGSEGKVIGIDRFGLSAPSATVFKQLGITTEAILAVAK